LENLHANYRAAIAVAGGKTILDKSKEKIMIQPQFILFVKDQEKSTSFYKSVLDLEPVLNVPGMTEFELCKDCKLGLMPVAGKKKMFGEKIPDSTSADGIPRTELYLIVEKPLLFHQRAIKMGAKEVSGLEKRGWGHNAAYSLDLDGHLLAFAEVVKSN